MRRVVRSETAGTVSPFTATVVHLRYREDMSHLLEFFYADHCFACPEARDVLRRFASGRADVVVIERNINDEAEWRLAAQYHLVATPAFVIDGRAVLYGVPQLDKLAARVSASTSESS